MISGYYATRGLDSHGRPAEAALADLGLPASPISG
jgi:hypothetical protein